MRDAFGQAAKAGVIIVLIACFVILVLDPPGFGRLEDLLAIVLGAIAIVLVAAWMTVKAIGREMPESEFRRLSKRSEELARLKLQNSEPTSFDELVAQALDELPEEFQKVLAETPVIVSDLGQEHRAYGHYIGGTVARDYHPDQIVIYRDTLERDFGYDPQLLRDQVVRTVRHEIAHHLGWDEEGVRNLGL